MTGDGTTALEARDRRRESEESSVRVSGTVVGAGTHRVALALTQRSAAFPPPVAYSSRGGGGELRAETGRREENTHENGRHQEQGKAAALGPNLSMASELYHREADNRPRGTEEELLEGSCTDKRPWERKF
jgi:hypothetical protein